MWQVNSKDTKQDLTLGTWKVQLVSKYTLGCLLLLSLIGAATLALQCLVQGKEKCNTKISAHNYRVYNAYC